MSDERYCGHCGAQNPDFAPKGEDIQEPHTIAELQAYCEARGMPLEKMRFFIGQDYPEARAFGIYQDGVEFVVYKNKDDGSRAVRYRGQDEAYAVRELFKKLLDECHRRDIWPDGRPEGGRKPSRSSVQRRNLLSLAVFIAALVIGIAGMLMDRAEHRHDGYYRAGGTGLYYRYGSDWFYDALDTFGWNATSYIPDEDTVTYLGDDYSEAWGGESFESSPIWEDLHESSSSSDDYDSWDSGDTDWSSDW